MKGMGRGRTWYASDNLVTSIWDSVENSSDEEEIEIAPEPNNKYGAMPNDCRTRLNESKPSPVDHSYEWYQ